MTLHKTLLLMTLVLFAAMPALAHDPKEHAKPGAVPDCAALKGMDLSRMDRNDPLMLALMKKCENQLHSADPQGTAAGGDARQDDPAAAVAQGR